MTPPASKSVGKAVWGSYPQQGGASDAKAHKAPPQQKPKQQPKQAKKQTQHKPQSSPAVAKATAKKKKKTKTANVAALAASVGGVATHLRAVPTAPSLALVKLAPARPITGDTHASRGPPPSHGAMHTLHESPRLVVPQQVVPQRQAVHNPPLPAAPPRGGAPLPAGPPPAVPPPPTRAPPLAVPPPPRAPPSHAVPVLTGGLPPLVGARPSADPPFHTGPPRATPLPAVPPPTSRPPPLQPAPPAPQAARAVPGHVEAGDSAPKFMEIRGHVNKAAMPVVVPLQSAPLPRVRNRQTTVLMVAEKPSVAQSIASALAQGRIEVRKNGKGLSTHEFTMDRFPPTGQEAVVRVMGVVGHIFSLDFKDVGRRLMDHELFDADTERIATQQSKDCGVEAHLKREARNCEHIVMWLDCDREGENICYEVLHVLEPTCKRFGSMEHVFRARFSALTQPALRHAFNTLVRPDIRLSNASEARRELDLKIGVAFTRFLSRKLRTSSQAKWNDPDLRTISYGPCQTPCLGFVVKRHDEIIGYQGKQLFSLSATVSEPRLGTLKLTWAQNGKETEEVAGQVAAAVLQGRIAECASAVHERKTKPVPAGLNTVQLLKTASSHLRLSPQVAMHHAERLYQAGFLSYPRTESTRYPDSYDAGFVVQSLLQHEEFGPLAQGVMEYHRGHVRIPTAGIDVGDHPPITPLRCANPGALGRDEWGLYQMVVRHFLGTLSRPMTYSYSRYRFRLHGGDAGGQFSTSRYNIVDRGFTESMPWMGRSFARRLADEEGEALSHALPISQGDRLQVTRCDVTSAWSQPPPYLTEEELISEMDKHGVGTDSSIPQHVENISTRGYALVCGDRYGAGRAFGRSIRHNQQDGLPDKGEGRYVVPTELGVALIHGMRVIDSELVVPEVRAHIEGEVSCIADGRQTPESVVSENLKLFVRKFAFFTARVASIEAYFSHTSGVSEPQPIHPYPRQYLDTYYASLAAAPPAERKGSQNDGKNFGKGKGGDMDGKGRKGGKGEKGGKDFRPYEPYPQYSGKGKDGKGGKGGKDFRPYEPYPQNSGKGKDGKGGKGGKDFRPYEPYPQNSGKGKGKGMGDGKGGKGGGKFGKKY